MPVEHPQFLAARQDARAELLAQARGAQGPLAGVLVDVEHAALGAGGGGGVQVEDRRLDAVRVQHAGEGEPAQSAADDGYGVVRVHEALLGGHCGTAVRSMPLISAWNVHDRRASGEPVSRSPATAASRG
ncbi:hypothetical protein GCM10020295_72830 [Streptomyces cinereospinus]